MKTIIINTLFILISTFAFAQQNNPSLIIDLTEKQAFERYKKSNVRKALGLKIKDFNYKDLIQNARVDKLSELAIFQNSQDKKFLDFASHLYSNGTTILRKDGTPKCDDCSTIIYEKIEDIKHWTFGYSYY